MVPEQVGAEQVGHSKQVYNRYSLPELIQGSNNDTVNRFYKVTTWTLEELDCIWDMSTVDPL